MPSSKGGGIFVFTLYQSKGDKSFVALIEWIYADILSIKICARPWRVCEICEN